LEQNALAVSQMVGSLLQGPDFDSFPTQDLVKSQVNNLAFLTQTRIQLFNPDGSLLVDSGDPQTLRVASTLSLQIDLEEDGQSFRQSIGRETGEEKYTTALVIEDEGGRFESQTTVSGSLVDPAAGIEGQALTLVGLQPPGTLGLAKEPGIRSEEIFLLPILDLRGRSLGQVELSEGPAFGLAILAGVTRGLLVAGLIAVILATSVGWLISQRLTRPVQQLVQVTEQMSAGDLSVRANITRGDELGQLALSFNRMADRIEGTVAALTNFVADAAHEMNTPLTALRTHLELAARNGNDDVNLTSAIAQATRLESLNDDLLQLSRLEGGIGIESLRPVDLGQLLGQRSERYAAQAEQAGLNFELTLPQQSLNVEGNRDLMSRAFSNVIDNAIKFTPQGGRVKLALSGEGSWAMFTVTDSGIGIEEADLDLIFGRFHRGRNAAEYPGSGLGLAIARSIIEAHGGRIEVESSPGRTQVKLYMRLIDPS
jgi:signal transduction histidine kinase